MIPICEWHLFTVTAQNATLKVQKMLGVYHNITERV